MKKSELQSLINECIGEVLNEGKAKKKKEAIKKIKSIIVENELSEADLAEIDVRGAIKKGVDVAKKAFTTEPATDAELDAYLASPSRKEGAKSVLKYEPTKLKNWREFVKKTFPKQIRNKEAFNAMEYKDGEWVKSEGPSGGKSTSFFN